MRQPKVCVVGAGISGLAAAWWLARQGADIHVLESGSAAGGAVTSRREDGYLVESGPNSMLVNSFELTLMLGELGLSDQIVAAAPNASKRFICRNGKLVAVPMGPGAFLTTPLFSAGAKLRLLSEPFRRRPKNLAEESLACFVRRRLGAEVLDYAVNPMVAGVYAGDPRRLSIQAAFPALADWEARHGSLLKGAIKSRADKRARGQIPFKSVLISFRDGMGKLVDALGQPLTGRIHLQSAPCAINQVEDGTWEVAWQAHDGSESRETFSALVLAVPAHALRTLPLPQSVCDSLYGLGDIAHPPIASVVLGYRAADVEHPLDGFGYLVPEVEGRKVLGTLFSSTLFPQRAPDGHVSLTTFVGGRRQPELAGLPRDELLGLVTAEHREMLGCRGQPVFSQLTKWQRSIPQYDIGHPQILEQAVAAEKQFPGLHLCGNYRGGIAVGQCLMNGVACAKRVWSFYR